MEYGGKSRCSAEPVIVLGKCFQDILHTGKHEGIDFSLVLPGKIAKLAGQGKGDQIVRGRQTLP